MNEITRQLGIIKRGAVDIISEGELKKKLEEAINAKEALKSENSKLKSELAEATASLAEVYKALCEK